MKTAPGRERPGSWGVPAWVRKAGLTSWLMLGIAGALVLAGLAFAATSGIAVPLIAAVVVGAVCVPLVDFLAKLHIPRWLGSLLVTIGLVAVAIGVVVVVVWGIVQDAGDIEAQIESGVQAVADWADDVGLDDKLPFNVKDQVASSGQVAVGGVLSLVVGGISSATSFIIGGFIALNILFFLMKDAHVISAWLRERTSGIVATALLGDSARSLRAYFRGRTIVGLASGITVYLGALVLDLPLAAAIALVTFITGYIPYVGAFIAGTFAVLIALGDAGLGQAIGILIVMLFANGVVENLVTPFAVGATLQLHPLVILIVTILGGSIAGFIGITLAAPLTAIGIGVFTKLRESGAFDEPAPDAMPGRQSPD